MFQKGDKVVYPMYGAGIIDAVEEAEDQKMEHCHYVIRIPNGNLKIKVAVEKTERIGLRPISDMQTIDSALEQAAGEPVVLQSNWNLRYKENLEKIGSGHLVAVAEVARALALRERERGLSSAEKKMFHNTKQILSSEIAYVQGVEQEKAEDYLAKKLFHC